MADLRREIPKRVTAFAALLIAASLAFVIYDRFVVPSLSEVQSVPLWWWAIWSSPLLVAGIGLGLFVYSASGAIRVATAGTLGLLTAYGFAIDGRVNGTYDVYFFTRLGTGKFFGLLLLIFLGWILRRRDEADAL